VFGEAHANNLGLKTNYDYYDSVEMRGHRHSLVVQEKNPNSHHKKSPFNSSIGAKLPNSDWSKRSLATLGVRRGRQSARNTSR